MYYIVVCLIFTLIHNTRFIPIFIQTAFDGMFVMSPIYSRCILQLVWCSPLTEHMNHNSYSKLWQRLSVHSSSRHVSAHIMHRPALNIYHFSRCHIALCLSPPHPKTKSNRRHCKSSYYTKLHYYCIHYLKHCTKINYQLKEDTQLGQIVWSQFILQMSFFTGLYNYRVWRYSGVKVSDGWQIVTWSLFIFQLLSILSWRL